MNMARPALVSASMLALTALVVLSPASCSLHVILGSGPGAGGAGGGGTSGGPGAGPGGGAGSVSGGATGVTSSGSGSGVGGGGAASGTVTLIFDVGTTDLNPWGIAVDAASVYFTDAQGPGGEVVRVPLDGSPASTIATQQDLPSAIAVDATHAYFIAAGLMRVPLASGPVVQVSPAEDAGYASVVVDDTNVYWTNYASAGSTMRLPKAGGPAKAIDTGDAYPSGIAVQGGSVYWAVMEAEQIKSAPIAGGAVTVVASGQQYPRSGLATDSTHVYWINEGSFPNHLVKAPLAGGPAVNVAAAPGDASTPQSLIVDATHAYFINPDTDTCGIVKVELSTGTVSIITLGGSVGCPNFLAGDAASIYYTSRAGITRIVK